MQNLHLLLKHFFGERHKIFKPTNLIHKCWGNISHNVNTEAKSFYKTFALLNYSGLPFYFLDMNC